MIPAEASFAVWREDANYIAAFTALEDEFSRAATMIARAHAGMTQERLAARMHTTQAVIARLKGGRVKPPTRTLDRRRGDRNAASDFIWISLDAAYFCLSVSSTAAMRRGSAARGGMPARSTWSS